MSSIWLIVSGAVLAVYGLYCIYMKTVKATCHCSADLTGKTVIITGSDKGIGYYTALELARRKARVILACRNMAAATSAARDIRLASGNENVIVEQVDVSLLASVRRFADKINSNEQRLDVLINNAGVADYGNNRTGEGLEVCFATNYVGPVLLTQLLLGKLKQSAPSRIVNVASVAHKFGPPLDLSNLNAEKYYDAKNWYFNTKLAVVTYTRELAKRLDGTGVTVNCLHPGTVNTNLFDCLHYPLRMVFMLLGKLFFRSPQEGAQTTIHVAVSREVDGVTGQYFSECKIATPSRYALDDAVAKKLYDISEKYIQLR